MKSKKPCNVLAMDVIARNYDKLKSSLVIDSTTDISGRSYEDIFGDTCLLIYNDPKASSLKTDAEIVEHFKYRFKMIRFRVFAESKEKRITNENIKDDEERIY